MILLHREVARWPAKALELAKKISIFQLFEKAIKNLKKEWKL